MTDQTEPNRTQQQPETPWHRAGEIRASEPPLHRFLGGSPVNVLVRLVFISLIVGALLMWLDIRPIEIFAALDRLVRRLWDMGFDAIRLVIEYVLAGAVIVVPIWLVLRLLNSRSTR